MRSFWTLFANVSPFNALSLLECLSLMVQQKTGNEKNTNASVGFIDDAKIDT
jgi:hypothetical protein